MELLKPLQSFFASWWAYFDFCLDADLQAIVCKPFWTWVMVALYGVGALVAVWVTVRVVSRHLKLRAALRAEAERSQVANDDTMRLYVWNGDRPRAGEEDAASINRRVEETLVERRKETGAPPAG